MAGFGTMMMMPWVHLIRAMRLLCSNTWKYKWNHCMNGAIEDTIDLIMLQSVKSEVKYGIRIQSSVYDSKKEYTKCQNNVCFSRKLNLFIWN